MCAPLIYTVLQKYAHGRVETKPSEIDNPRHHDQIDQTDNAAFVCVHVMGGCSKDFSEGLG